MRAPLSTMAMDSRVRWPKALSSRPEARLLTVMDRAATTIKKLGLA